MVTDIETSRQVKKINKNKKKSHYRSSHYGTVAILAPSLHTCIITKTDTDISLRKRKILMWSKFYIKLKYIKSQY